MARRMKGTVLERTTKGGTVYALRFTALGKRHYMTVGADDEGWTRERAQRELAFVLGQIERGVWEPPRKRPDPAPEPAPMPTFGEFAAQWLERQKVKGGRRGTGLSPVGIADLTWRLRKHLLPYFARVPLDAITVKDVDRYVTRKLAEGEISPSSINKTLATMAAVLELAVEYEEINRNVAKSSQRRAASSPPRRSYLDRADHIAALVDAAGELDRDARMRVRQRRPLIATLVFAGLRIGEALALRWRDVDLARGTIAIRASKTDAGERTVDMLPVLRDELLAYRAALPHVDRDALVFGTSKGTKQGQSNVRRRVLAPAVTRASERLAARGEEPLPERLTPHSLRRTFASLLFAINEPPPYVMAQLGHTTPALTLAIYARQMDRRDGEPELLRALVQGEDLGHNGAVSRPGVAAGSGAVAA